MPVVAESVTQGRDWANKPIFDTEEELVKSRKKGTRWNELGTLMTGVRLRTLGVADIRRRWIELLVGVRGDRQHVHSP